MLTRDRHAISTTLLDAAVLAPSMHNRQPWRFEVGSRTVRVYRDLDRWLRAEDPRQTALYVSLGAVVLNLRVAAAELGYLAHVSLLPDPHDDDHVATLTLAAGLGYDMELRPLFPYLRRRRTNRMPFGDRPVPDWVLRDLEATARWEHAVLQVVRDPARVRLLLGIAAEGSSNELFDPNPLLALLAVHRDDRVGWLAAGQALERVLLSAARWGLSASFLNQALDGEQLCRLADEPGQAVLHPQMLLRLGYVRQPGAVSSPRCPVADVLLDD